MNKLLIVLCCIVYGNVIGQSQEKFIKSKIDELHSNTIKTQDSVSVLIRECNIAIDKSQDSIFKNKLNKRLTYLWSILDASYKEQVKNDLDFAMSHPNSALCLELVISRMKSQEGIDFYDRYKEVYENFSDEIKSSDNGKLMKEQLKYFKQSKVGSIAPDFSVIDVNGDRLTLSDFKNKKYILLEFWASWCAPCLKDQEYLKKIYAKFNKHDLEIISLSRDVDIEKWKKAIIKHKTDVWRHACVVRDSNDCGSTNTIIFSNTIGDDKRKTLLVAII